MYSYASGWAAVVGADTSSLSGWSEGVESSARVLALMGWAAGVESPTGATLIQVAGGIEVGVDASDTFTLSLLLCFFC